MADYAKPDSLVSTEWVAENLNRPEGAADRGRRRHGRLRHRPHPRRGRLELEDAARDAGDARHRRQGRHRASCSRRPECDKDTTVVLYGDNNNWFAAYALWVLKYYGLENVEADERRAQEVDRRRARAVDRPAELPAAAKSASRGRRRRSARCATRCSSTWTRSARARARWWTCARRRSTRASCSRRRTCRRKARSGAGTSRARRTSSGRRRATRTARSRQPTSLTELYGGQGVTPDKDVIAYCRIGERSAHTWFVLTHLLGYKNVRNYDGSWTEWGSLIGAPIER